MTTFPQNKYPQAFSARATLLMSDVDESFIYGKDGKYDTTGLSKTSEVIHRFQNNNSQPFYVWWSTVRVLDTIQKIANNPELKSILNRFKLDGLIVNNGKQMFVNKTNKNAADWISSLNTDTQDQQWQHHIEDELHWKPKSVDSAIRNAFQEVGFRKSLTLTPPSRNPFKRFFEWLKQTLQFFHLLPQGAKKYQLPEDDLRPPYEIWQNSRLPQTVLYYSPLHNAVRLANWEDKNWQTDNKSAQVLFNAILAKFKDKNIQFESPEIQTKQAHDKNSDNALSLIRLNPKGVDKATTTQFALNYLIHSVNRIIVVGDDKPDKILLSTNYTQVQDDQLLPLLKKVILCIQPDLKAKDSPIKELFGDKSLDSVQSISGDIGEALQKTYG